MTSWRPAGSGAGTAAMAASMIEPHIPVSSALVFLTIEVSTSTTGPFERSSPHNFNHFLRIRCLFTASEREGLLFLGVSAGPSVGTAAESRADLALAAIDTMSMSARIQAHRERSVGQDTGEKTTGRFH